MAYYLVSSDPNDHPDKRHELQATLGLAISNWAGVEDGLSSIFVTAISAKSSASAIAAFTAIASFDAQLDMVDAAMRITFKAKTTENDEIRNAWTYLAKQTDKLRKRRKSWSGESAQIDRWIFCLTAAKVAAYQERP